jgi:hypothetical protein
MPPGISSGMPKLGAWRREFGGAVVIWDRVTKKYLSASLADFDDLPHETEMTWRIRFSLFPAWLHRLQ